MPYHDYVCDNKKCGHTFEHLHGLTEPDLIECPACGKDKLRKLFGVPSVDDPKTIGGLADKNSSRMPEKAKRVKKKYQPWYRSGKGPINVDKIKDVRRYIEHGER